MALLARQLYFEAVKVGDELPPLVKPPVDRTQIARFAGASGDFNPLYVDEHLARNAGFPSALAAGMLVMGFLGELVVDWLRGARLRRYAARFVKIVWPGDVITCRGRVIDRRFEGNGVYAVDIEVWAENQRGELVLKGLVTSQLYYNADDDARQRAGQAPLVITPEEEEARLAKLSRAQSGKRPEAPRVPPSPPPRPEAARAQKPAAPAAASAGTRPAASPRPAVPGRGAPPPQRPTVPERPAAARPAPARPAVGPAQPAKAPAARSSPARPVEPTKAAVKPATPRAAAGKPSGARSAAATKASSAPRRPSGTGRPAARPRPASRVKHGPAKHPAARPPPKQKPAARGSRPRAGTKPTGKKRR